MIKVIKKTLAVCIVRDAGVNFPISPPCCDYFDVKNISNTITLWLGLGSELRLRIWLVSFFLLFSNRSRREVEGGSGRKEIWGGVILRSVVRFLCSQHQCAFYYRCRPTNVFRFLFLSRF